MADFQTLRARRGTLIPRWLSFAIASQALLAAIPLFAANEPGTKSQTVLSPPLVAQGSNGWLFLGAELRFLQQPVFWGNNAKKAARSPKPEFADPLPAISQFQAQLQKAGIELLLVPVPPKAAIYSSELGPENKGPFYFDALDSFYAELKGLKIPFIDLRPVFKDQIATAPEPLFCKTDSHWSGTGCVTASKAISEALRPILSEGSAKQPKLTFQEKWVSTPIRGDLVELLHPGAQTSDSEAISMRQISSSSGDALQPDPSSPILLMGDSHTLVFHEFLGERSGLLEQIAHETGFIPDLIGTRGSGATAVRVSLLRRSIKDPNYLSSKKVIVWCFAAREFTEADQGWQPLPIRR